MDIKQLVTGDPKTGFYPVTQDTITVIELNKSVMSLTNESSSEEIIAAFDNLESFQALIVEVRNPQNICSGILVNETPEDKRVGKYEATIIANTNTETLHVRWVENDRIIALSITNTDGTMSCIRNENNVGGGSGENDVYVFGPTGSETITLEEYTALENAINSNKVILYNTGEIKYLFTIALIRDEIIILSNVNADINNIQISKAELKIKTETIRLVTLDQVLTKSNTEPFTPDADYEPATKKYVDDSTVYKYEYKQFSYQYEIGNNSISNSFQYEASVNISKKSYIAGVNFKSSNGFIYSLVLPGSIIEYQAESNITCNADFRFNEINSLGYKVSLHIIVEGDLKINFNNKTINYNITNVNAICEQCVLTESEYAALGTTPNTDNILYFVTPDE